VPDAVLPCLDEAAALPWVLGRMPTGYRAIVADNDSTDGSPDVARAHGATVVRATPRGFGAACHAGLDAPTPRTAGLLPRRRRQSRPAAAAARGRPLLAGPADLVLGRRRPTTRGAWPLHARLGQRRARPAAAPPAGVRRHDLGPMRACRRERLRALDLQRPPVRLPARDGHAARAAGWRVVEVDVDYLPRSGRSKVTGTARGTARTVRDMSRVLREVREPLTLPCRCSCRQGAGRGPGEDRLCPPLTPQQAADVAAAAIEDTSPRSGRSTSPSACSSSRATCARRLHTVPQGERAVRRPLAAAFDDAAPAGRPPCSSAWTPRR
jgi:hypothetical protein